MSSSRAAAKKKKQLVLIAVLLVGLFVAIMTQPSTTKRGKVDVKKTPMISPVALKPKTTPKSIELEGEVIKITDLPSLTFDTIAESNLFFVPEPEPEPEAETTESDLVIEEELPPVVVKAIYGGHDNAAPRRVLIDDSIVSPGETLPDGRVILDITAGGVSIAK